jgi:hypothetical protein
MGFGFMTGFIKHLYNLLLHFTNQYMTNYDLTSPLSSTAVSRESLSPLLSQGQGQSQSHLWSNGQSSWLQIQIFCEIVGLERGPPSLVRITEELLEWKSSGSGSRKPRLTAVRIRCGYYATPSIRKSWY